MNEHYTYGKVWEQRWYNSLNKPTNDDVREILTTTEVCVTKFFVYVNSYMSACVHKANLFLCVIDLVVLFVQ